MIQVVPSFPVPAAHLIWKSLNWSPRCLQRDWKIFFAIISNLLWRNYVNRGNFRSFSSFLLTFGSVWLGIQLVLALIMLAPTPRTSVSDSGSWLRYPLAIQDSTTSFTTVTYRLDVDAPNGSGKRQTKIFYNSILRQILTRARTFLAIIFENTGKWTFSHFVHW